MNLPRVYGARWILCFSLPSGADKAKIFENLRAGLAHTVLSIPFIAGHIGLEEGSDPDENRVQILDSSDGVLFRYKDLTGNLPSYADLKKQNFPLRHLPSAQIFPVGIIPGSPALVFASQANFVDGGLLLTAAIHHAAGDAVALQTILNAWAQNTGAVEGGNANAFTAYDAKSNDRGPLMDGVPPSADAAADFPEYVLSPTLKPDPAAAAAASATFQMPPMETRLFRFAPATLAGLKADAAAFSTHDALCAFLWRVVTRARLLPPADNNKSSSSSSSGDGDAAVDSAFAYAVNIRRRASPPLPPTYLGNASMLGLTGRLSAAAISGPGGLALAAGAIRASLRARFPDKEGDGDAVAAAGPGRVARTIGLMASRRDPTDYKMAYRAFLGPDVVATSWADVAVYGTAWGGVLGAPEGFRAPGDGADGVVTILPRRRAQDGGGLDIQLGLESGAMARLLADEEFARVAEPGS
ncbi:hypothetical protein RB595_005047 [Gaeumannomyces hyphopodioides]